MSSIPELKKYTQLPTITISWILLKTYFQTFLFGTNTSLLRFDGHWRFRNATNCDSRVSSRAVLRSRWFASIVPSDKSRLPAPHINFKIHFLHENTSKLKIWGALGFRIFFSFQIIDQKIFSTFFRQNFFFNSKSIHSKKKLIHPSESSENILYGYII